MEYILRECIYVIHHFNGYFFFSDYLFLAINLIPILYFGNGVRQKANWRIFLYKLKVSGTAVETARSINRASGPGTAKELSAMVGQNFYKDDSL